jgi:hypothetical protein
MAKAAGLTAAETGAAGRRCGLQVGRVVGAGLVGCGDWAPVPGEVVLLLTLLLDHGQTVM